MRKIRLDLRDIKPGDLLAKIRKITYKMTGNPHFVHPTPSISELTAAGDLLSEYIVASKTGDRERIAMRRKQEDVVKDLLRRLASYTAFIARTESQILSTGFDLRRLPTKRLPSRPSELEAVRSEKEGVVKLKWKPVQNSKHYVVEMATGNTLTQDAEWQTMMFLSRSTCKVENLEPGKYYWFRVRALGTQGTSPYSDPATVMAA